MGMLANEGGPVLPSPIERLIGSGTNQVAQELKSLLSLMHAGQMTSGELKNQIGLAVAALVDKVETGR